jgi:alpha-L-rhamnosidase
LFHWDISDHEALESKPEAFSASAFYYHHIKLAEILHRYLEEKMIRVQYAKIASTIKNAIIKKYLFQVRGRFDNGTQSAQLFALWYELTPDVGKTFEQLLKRFERHGWHTSSGIFGNKMMFDVLRRQNRNDVAYKVANQEDYPGWGFMLKSGATTLWETWSYPENFPLKIIPCLAPLMNGFIDLFLGLMVLLRGLKRS